MVGAGLLARNAVERGLRTKSWVKTSLAPGSKVVTKYLERSGLMTDLEALGFHTVGYGVLPVSETQVRCLRLLQLLWIKVN